MKKLDKLEKVVPAPDTTFYGAYYYDGKEIELCDDTETLEDDDGQTTTYIRVKDTVKNGILYKEKELKVKQKDGRYIIENTKKELPLEIGTMLIYVMYEGFVQTRSKMITIDKAIKRYELLKSPKGE